MKYTYTLALLLLHVSWTLAQNQPLKLGIAGLSHTHVHWILGYNKNDVTLVGIVESDSILVQKYADQYGFSREIVYGSLEDLYANVEVEAIAAFGTIFDHLEVVEKSAPRGIDVMVEKPLAVSNEHANRMAELAEKYNIPLITNYETTWYPTNHKAKELLDAEAIGDLQKIIVSDGHRGPKKIGVNKEFLDWLTDPVLNGGGALFDFGCYGANLATWLQKGKRPISVTAITQQLQPGNNPKVDDECIIILEYENSNAVLQPSWNWPMGRKDMEIYGLTGALYVDNKRDLRIRMAEGYDGFTEEKMTLSDLQTPYDNPFSYFAYLIRGDLEMQPYDLSSIENNLIVVEILEAARKSAIEKKTIYLTKDR
ncbi:Gfo/Idh/MocA family protein [Portibacter marinus]|uniref:Gfo/Idh/MocA family protein n=1 Tax=Portibacter marinus TaxID=2898660 RepID=UPI001F326AAA|nr:Gfo/Idh/MocA family oxidoreductase [Portibacter marinus]